MAPHNVILCCDCEGTHRQIDRIVGAIDGAGVPANFFFVGETVREFPSLIRDISSRHQTESHTDTHPNLRKLRKRAQRDEIMGGRRAVEEVIGRPTRGFRAPMHCINRDTAAVLNEEKFTFDASRLYFRINMGRVNELHPTWFREWMPLYERINLKPRTAFAWFALITKLLPLSVLPVHPHYAGKNDALAAAFRWFLEDAVSRGVRFWSVDRYLQVYRGIAPPEWLSPMDYHWRSVRPRPILAAGVQAGEDTGAPSISATARS